MDTSGVMPLNHNGQRSPTKRERQTSRKKQKPQTEKSYKTRKEN